MLKRVLVLDDDESILDVMQEILSYEHFEVKSIAESKNLIQEAEAFSPDLFILDYRISGTNGGKICRQIKSHPKFINTPVIIFSAYITRYEDIMAYGCDAIIDKPFDLDELMEKINNLIY